MSDGVIITGRDPEARNSQRFPRAKCGVCSAMHSMAVTRASWCVLASLELIQSMEWVCGLGNTHTHTHTHTCSLC